MINTESVPPLAASVKPTARLHLNSPHTYYGEPYASPVSLGVRSETAAAEVEERYHYINHTHLPITISRRDGLPMTLSSVRSHTSSDFIIRRVLILKHMALNSALRSINSFTELDCSELDALRQVFKNFDTGTYREASVMLDYVVSMKDLQDKGGSIYHYQLDIAISSKDAALAPPHPYSSRFLNIGGFGDVNQYKDQKELNLKLRYVDHSPVASKKYINIGGRVFALTPQKDAPYSRISGKVNGKLTEMIFSDHLDVFYSANADPNVVNNTGVGHFRVPLAEAKETMGLYETYDDAQNSGNVDATRKERLNRLAHELELMRADVAREKVALEKEDLRLRQELLRDKQELERLVAANQREQADIELARKNLDMQRKAQDEQIEKEKREQAERLAALRDEREARLRTESMQWRDYFEMRSLERKDSSELVKLIPTVLLATLGVAAAWMKFSPSGKTGQ